MIGRSLGRIWKVLALSTVLTLGLASVALADEIYNNLDSTIDVERETMGLGVGETRTVDIRINPTSGDNGDTGCNFTSPTDQLVVKFKTADASRVTVSSDGGATFASEVFFTFTNCTDTKTLTVRGESSTTGVNIDVQEEFRTTVHPFNFFTGEFKISTSIAPVVDLNGGGAGTGHSATFTEDSGPGLIVDGTALTVADADNASLASATVTLTDRPDGSVESLDADTTGTTISKSYDQSTGELRLTGAATKADYQKVLRTVTYNNTTENPDTTDRSVSFVVNDGTVDSSPATSTVAVNAVNDAPVNTVPGDQSTAEDAARVFSSANNNRISISDSDAGGNPVAVTLAATNGTLTLSGTTGLSFSTGNGTGNRTMTFTGTVADVNNALDGLSFDPDQDYNGPASLDVTTNDQGNSGPGGAESDADQVGITVTPVNDAPVASNDSANVNEDGSVNVSVLNNDADVDGNGDIDPASVKVVSTPQNGTVTVNADGTIAYGPNKDFNGADSFTYEVCDKGSPALCSTATVNVSVAAVNDAPVANDDTVSTPEDTPLTIESSSLLANDNDGATNETQDLTITALSNAVRGSVELNNDGTITFTPEANYNGNDASFDYTVSDGQGNSSTATANVNVTVTSVNDAPVANDDSATVNEDGFTNIATLDNDIDADGYSDLDPASVTVSVVPQHGTATANADGTITYTPDVNFNGADSFSYQVCDAAGLCDTATVNVSVSAVNDDPVARNNAYDATTASRDVPLDVLANDTDAADNDTTLFITNMTQPPSGEGSVTLENGALIWDSNPDFLGTTQFTYTIGDGDGGTATATVTVTVTGVNEAPIVRDDLGSTAAAAAVSNSFVSQYASPEASTPTRLYRLDTALTPYTFDKIGKDIPRPMNAIGYRKTDRMLYGYRMISSPGIMKVNPTTGASKYLGNPKGLPPSNSYAAGDVSPNGATYYLYASKSGVLWKVNLKTFKASSVKLSSRIVLLDFAASPTDGNLYGVEGKGKLVRVNPTTGRVTFITVAGLSPGAYGATWFTAKGDLIAYENGKSKPNGTLNFIGSPTTKPRLLTTQPGPSTVGNDGAANTAPPKWAGLSVEVDVLANDSDPDGLLARNTLRIVQQPANGTVRINADKTITYTSGSSYRGTDSFRYEVCDNGEPRQCGTATVNITSATIKSSTTS